MILADFPLTTVVCKQFQNVLNIAVLFYCKVSMELIDFTKFLRFSFKTRRHFILLKGMTQKSDLTLIYLIKEFPI